MRKTIIFNILILMTMSIIVSSITYGDYVCSADGITYNYNVVTFSSSSTAPTGTTYTSASQLPSDTAISKDIGTGVTTYTLKDGSVYTEDNSGNFKLNTPAPTEAQKKQAAMDDKTTYTVYGQTFNSKAEAEAYKESLKTAEAGDTVSLDLNKDGTADVTYTLGEDGLWRSDNGYTLDTETMNARIKANNPELGTYNTALSTKSDNRYSTREESTFDPQTGQSTGSQMIVTDSLTGNINQYNCNAGGTCTCGTGSSSCKEGSTIEKSKIDNTAKFSAAMNTALKGLGSGMDMASSFSTLSQWLGGWDKDEVWLSSFQEKYKKYFSIDSYISEEICKIATDENEATTDVYFSDGTVGAHIEGYDKQYSALVSCTNMSECRDLFGDKTLKCVQGYCADANSTAKVFEKTAYRVSLSFSPSTRVLKKGQIAKFTVKLKPSGQLMDLNNDGKRDSSDEISLARGSSDYSKSVAELALPGTTYTNVCMEFEGNPQDIFTSEFYTLFQEVATGNSLCNSFIAEGTDTGNDGSGAPILGSIIKNGVFS